MKYIDPEPEPSKLGVLILPKYHARHKPDMDKIPLLNLKIKYGDGPKLTW